MNPLVVVTHRIHADAIELLSSLCDVALVTTRTAYARQDLQELARNARAVLAATPERIDDSLLAGCNGLRIVACTFRIPEHIDMGACTRRGIWVTNVMAHWLGKEAEIEAARNILDVLSGDTPRGALNEVLQAANPDSRYLCDASHRINAAATNAATSWDSTKAGTSIGRIPANVSLAARASVTAGLANEVDAVNQ